MFYNTLILIIFNNYLVNSEILISKNEDYNEFEIPANETGSPLHIGCDFKTIAVIDVDTDLQSIELSIEFKMNWIDNGITISGSHEKVFVPYQILIKFFHYCFYFHLAKFSNVN